MSVQWDFAACRPGSVYGLEHELRMSESQRALTALQRLQPGKVACLQDGGGLVNNLRVWENLILPAWYHESASMSDLEGRVAAALDRVAADDSERVRLMASLPSTLSRTQCRTLALVRALVQAPTWLVVEVEWLAWLSGVANIHCKEAFGALARQCPVLLLGAGALPQAEALPEFPTTNTEECNAAAAR
ncbi:hypothetical protein [Jeongeupia chitinilytica]|uniref:Uncharacterized protein n=1 Tax=Jeongeupia chitinilytica TaxID=1041641 RepID=A0ABQ3GZK3_9NEIS|nr:hypothetical protein [Jeongeupia chitinilytica]GHD60145.1 hypothetical protein GCM10007350_12640 [Jeongeupia chitinilytica]